MDLSSTVRPGTGTFRNRLGSSAFVSDLRDAGGVARTHGGGTGDRQPGKPTDSIRQSVAAGGRSLGSTRPTYRDTEQSNLSSVAQVSMENCLPAQAHVS